MNRAFARQFYGGTSPIGKLVVQGTNGTQPASRVIIGLTATAKYRSMREDDPPTFYEAIDDAKNENMLLLYVRTLGPPAEIVSAVRKAGAAVDAGVPLIEALTLEREIQTSLWQERLLALLAGFFGGMSALLAAIGLYGTLAYSVARRTRELGIRVAIGAQLRHIVQTVSAPIGIAVSCGLSGGLTAAVFLLKPTERLLYGVKPLDPVSIAVASVAILLGCGLAAAMPIRSACRVRPSEALREE